MFKGIIREENGKWKMKRPEQPDCLKENANVIPWFPSKLG